MKRHGCKNQDRFWRACSHSPEMLTHHAFDSITMY